MRDADTLARRVAECLHAREGTGAAWNVEIEDVREGYARIAMAVRADMLNGKAIAHGGMIFALADTAFAYACNSRNLNTVAQSATVNFLAPGQLGDTLVAEAREQALSGEDRRVSGPFQGDRRGGPGRELIDRPVGLLYRWRSRGVPDVHDRTQGQKPEAGGARIRA
jgi:acyl-CoA thioesterase